MKRGNRADLRAEHAWRGSPGPQFSLLQQKRSPQRGFLFHLSAHVSIINAKTSRKPYRSSRAYRCAAVVGNITEHLVSSSGKRPVNKCTTAINSCQDKHSVGKMNLSSKPEQRQMLGGGGGGSKTLTLLKLCEFAVWISNLKNRDH